MAPQSQRSFTKIYRYIFYQQVYLLVYKLRRMKLYVIISSND